MFCDGGVRPPVEVMVVFIDAHRDAHAVPNTVMIDATYLKEQRTASSLRTKKGDLATSGAA